LLNPADFREIVSGRQLGWKAACWRGVFSAVEPFYAAAVRYRNARYDRGRAAITRVNVPVISVGNLTLGGTGKTPMVEWLARWFISRNVRVALVSRGYGAKAGAANDEAKELHEKLPEVPHVLNPRRALGAREAIERYQAELIILDDGFQHRRLARDLDIVLMDATEPFGYEHIFPRGTLREPIEGLQRADVIALSRADAVDQAVRDSLRSRIQAVNPAALWLELSHVPVGLRNAMGLQRPLEGLLDKRLLAFCGIGNPLGFQHALKQCGFDVVEFREFPDHHAFSAADLNALAQLSANAKVDAAICTHKDLVKVSKESLGNAPLSALQIGLSVLVGHDALEARLAVLADRVLANRKMSAPDR
jgi:tetraacyldisaccharide 4'-kinase